MESKIGKVIVEKSKIKNTDFEEKLVELLTGQNPRKDLEARLKEEEEEINKRLKEIENENKIDYILGKTNVIPKTSYNNHSKNKKVNNKNKKVEHKNKKKHKNNKNNSKSELIDINLNDIDEYKNIIQNEANKKIIFSNKANIENENDLKEEYIFNLPENQQNFFNENKKQKKTPQPKIIPMDLLKNKQEELYEDCSNVKEKPIQKQKKYVYDKDDEENNLIVIKKNPLNIVKTNIKTNDEITNHIIESSFYDQEKKSKINKNKENIDLLNQYINEKKTNEELSNIISRNIAVAKNDLFVKDNPKFYNTNSNENKLQKAKEILFQKLTADELEQINSLNEQIVEIKNKYQDSINERKRYESIIKDIKEEINNNKENHKKELFNYERNMANEMRNIINKFKVELYKSELVSHTDTSIKLVNNKELTELNNQVENLNKIINDNNKKYKNESNNLQNEIQKFNIENEILIAKIKSYEEERIWSKLNFNNQESIGINKDNKKYKNFEEEYNNIQKSKIKAGEVINNVQALTKLKMEKIKNEKEIQNEEEDNIFFKQNERIETTTNHLKEIELTYPDKYHNIKNEIPIHQNYQPDGTIIREYNNGKKEILFSNGQKKIVFPDGYMIMYYVNGDIKQLIPNHKEVYFYSKDNTLQVKFNDGSMFLKYPDGKICNINK